MKNKPIIIVAGEPFSIFLEILFKSKKKFRSRNPINKADEKIEI